MKKLFAIGLVAMVAACGAEQNTSETKRSVHPGVAAQELFVGTTQGSITQVVAKAASVGMGMWTEVSIDYMIPCQVSFEKFAYSTQIVEGQLKIYASALTSSFNNNGQNLCQAFSHTTKTVAVPGIFTSDSVELINLTTPKSLVLPEGHRISLLENMEVVSASPLCPEEMTCFVDGTILTLSVAIGCLDSIGPISFAVEQAIDSRGNRINNVTVAAYAFANPQSKVAFCTADVKTIDLQLVNIYGSEDSFKIKVVK